MVSYSSYISFWQRSLSMPLATYSQLSHVRNSIQQRMPFVDGQRMNIWKVTQSKCIVLFPQILLVRFQKFDIMQQQYFSAARLGLGNQPVYFTRNMLCLVTQSCLNLCDTVNCKCHRLLCPWGFSRQEYWSGLPYPPPGDLPNSGIEPRPPTWQTDSVRSEPPGTPCVWGTRQ